MIQFLKYVPISVVVMGFLSGMNSVAVFVMMIYGECISLAYALYEAIVRKGARLVLF
jgi:hypothetical protein